MQHASLSPARWSAFPLHQQILMIGNEMNRASNLFAQEEREHLARSYERVLRLTDLTIETRTRRGLRRELLRWRDLVADLYQSPEPNPAAHRATFRCLLQLDPIAARQIPHLAELAGGG
jgi:hypothetical protein